MSVSTSTHLRFSLHLLTLLLFVALAVMSTKPLFAAENGSDPAISDSTDSKKADNQENLAELIKEVMDRKLSAMADLPILLFPKTTNSTLENLQPILKNNYFDPPRVTEVTLVKSQLEKFLWEKIVVHMKPFLIKGMPITSATMTFKGCEFYHKDLTDKGEFTITKVDNIILRVAAPIEPLSEFITAEAKKFGYLIPRFRSSNDGVQLYGPMQFLEFSGEVDVAGMFKVNRETRDMDFQIEKVSLGKSTVPSFVVDTISALVNPIFRIENFPYKLVPTKIAIEGAGSGAGSDLVIYGENANFLHKYKKIEYKSKFLKQYLNK
ncbi:MAG: hypothetical protein CVV64_08845 [Candidatus Wallbacteria bacterium HGW-Wallbacteria-1]|jgi:hypothetical protein|uniref:POTRA domain-containing protein n=1 Tax=Candidatus Wallbacteria bacterium HGW-Wallbacteria-1 TaxID=2013854 RepID=A0A2N1PQ40_9BACT|nr:MAG: hypothetical protein CVV64_08845 [Candidatus Wallbacteria bacterium HGW-Wallbacteria-1]